MCNKLFLLISILLISSLDSFSQAKIVSPYSAIGLGDIVDQNLYHSSMMGGLGAAFNSPNLFNSVNPAALGYLKMTAFDLGANFGFHELKEDNRSSNNYVGGIDYFSLAFPLRNPITEVLERKDVNYGWGMALSLKPYTKSGYDFTNVSWSSDSANIRKNIVGKGGTYKFSFGNGWRYKDASFGLNLGYLFGNKNQQRELIFTNLDNPYKQYFSDKISIKSFVWDAGVMYRIALNKKEKNTKKIKYLSIGLHASSTHKMNSTVDQFYWSQRANWSGVPSLDIRDTILDQSSSVSGTLPANFGIGLYYNDAVHHTFGVNLDWTGWSNFKHDVLEVTGDNELVDGIKISVGGSYTKEMSSYSFSKRISYKYGIYWIKDPRNIDGKQLQDIGFNIGTTMPLYFTRQISHLHLGLKMGRIGHVEKLTDSYATFTLGITFNDNKWFMKRKFN